ENSDHHFYRLFIFIHVVNNSFKRGKRPFGDLHLLVLIELDLEFRLVFGLRNPIDNVLNFFVGKRRRLLAGTHESGHARGGLNDVPDVSSMSISTSTYPG